MAVLDPILVEIAGATPASLPVPDFPQAPEKGSHEVAFSSRIFVDRSDFQEEGDGNFYGISPGRLVGLKYANTKIMLESVEKKDGVVSVLKCKIVENDEKPKSYITWVNSENPLKAEVRMYANLFTVTEPSDKWEEELNGESEVSKRAASASRRASGSR